MTRDNSFLFVFHSWIGLSIIRKWKHPTWGQENAVLWVAFNASTSLNKGLSVEPSTHPYEGINENRSAANTDGTMCPNHYLVGSFLT